jgi:hypothetical protein
MDVLNSSLPILDLNLVEVDLGVLDWLMLLKINDSLFSVFTLD